MCTVGKSMCTNPICTNQTIWSGHFLLLTFVHNIQLEFRFQPITFGGIVRIGIKIHFKTVKLMLFLCNIFHLNVSSIRVCVCVQMRQYHYDQLELKFSVLPNASSYFGLVLSFELLRFDGFESYRKLVHFFSTANATATHQNVLVVEREIDARLAQFGLHFNLNQLTGWHIGYPHFIFLSFICNHFSDTSKAI